MSCKGLKTGQQLCSEKGHAFQLYALIRGSPVDCCLLQHGAPFCGRLRRTQEKPGFGMDLGYSQHVFGKLALTEFVAFESIQRRYHPGLGLN